MAGPDGADPGSDPGSGRDDDKETGGTGARLGPGDLAPDEERLLAALERDARGLPEIPVRDTIPDVPAPGRDAPGPPDDGLTPLFAAPDLDD